MILKSPKVYAPFLVLEELSWRQNGATPDRIRDGKSGLVKSVTRTGPGIYSVALRTDRPSTSRHVTVLVSLHKIAANTTPVYAVYEQDSWSQSAGTFTVRVFTRAANAASDGDVGDRIAVQLVSAVSSVSQDAA